MQIDFHHAVTYVVARYAGFAAGDAEIIANASQYVDDSTESGYVHFDNGMRFFRQATAHPPLDPQNLDNDSDAESWLPFHFLPGADGGSSTAGVALSPMEAYHRRLVCTPGSPVARRMAELARRDAQRPWGLYRLGVVAHVLCDTWAHQGFVGLHHQLNAVEGIVDMRNGQSLSVVGRVLPPIGHAQALTYPDLPFLRWKYRTGGKEVVRDNPADFTTAADELSKVFQQWRGEQPSGLTPARRDALRSCLAGFDAKDADERHAKWLAAVGAGEFDFGREPLHYGARSWKDRALGGSSYRQAIVATRRAFPYPEDFMTSAWKLFHDAASAHRHDVFTHVLPEFSILMG